MLRSGEAGGRTGNVDDGLVKMYGNVLQGQLPGWHGPAGRDPVRQSAPNIKEGTNNPGPCLSVQLSQVHLGK